MSEMWKRWEGQLIDHKYRLVSLIGSTGHSVVFQAEYGSPEPRKATVKFVSADTPNAEQLLSVWHDAAQLSHPNLQRILQTGACKLGDMELLYVAMEYADENLAEIIPHRALTTDEAREAMNSVVETLTYLHGRGLTHGHICSPNILAVGEFLKVSSDTIEPLAEKREMTRERSEYDAPEIPGTPYTQASDIWSLGVTLVEMLTQQRATLPFDENADPVIPANVREPFLEIARSALRRKPELRWTIGQIAERLNPNASAAKAVAAAASTRAGAPAAATIPAAKGGTTGAAQAASATQVVSMTPSPAAGATPPVEPLSVPLSKEPAVPLAKQSRPSAPANRATVPEPKHAKRETLVLPNYALPMFLIVAILVAAFALPKILRNRRDANPVAASAPVKTAPAAEPTKPSTIPAEKVATTTVERKGQAQISAPTPASANAAPASVPADIRPPETTPAAKPENPGTPGAGEVLGQSLPQVSAKALSTVNGIVRVVVKTHVDGAGQVVQAELQEAGPSKYFADKAVQAAQHWVFTPPEVNGRSVESDWVIRFEYSHDGVKAFPQQVLP
ncbi:MAG TPA: protein kinase [Candidatus Saccharimonadales bacterium]|nr:protein kinase [Candidatus Saccharimonadales bacterium]